MAEKMITPWSFPEFARSICGQDKNGILVMLRAYFDESGTHGERSPAVTVAGLIGDVTEWEKLESLWRERLGLIPWFHAVDCQLQKKDFKDFTEPQSAQLFADLARLIADRKLTAIAGSVYTSEWNDRSSDKMREYKKHKYVIALNLAFAEVLKLIKEQVPDEQVSFFFAHHQEYGDHIYSVYHSFREENPAMVSLSFLEPKLVIPLQAADLYAYENYQELRTQLEHPELPKPNREALRIIDRAIPMRSIIARSEVLDRIAVGKFNDLPPLPPRETRRERAKRKKANLDPT